MSAIVVDTNVVSYILSRHPLAARFEALLREHAALISFFTLAEVYRGAAKASWGERRIRELEAYLRRYVVVPPRRDICWVYAQICATSERKGRRLTEADAFIAATAVALSLPLLTNDVRDFEMISELKIIS